MGRHKSLRAAQPPNQRQVDLTRSWSPPPRVASQALCPWGGQPCRGGFSEGGALPVQIVRPGVKSTQGNLRGEPNAIGLTICECCPPKGACRCPWTDPDPHNSCPTAAWVCVMLGGSTRPSRRGAGVKPAGAGVAVWGQREGAEWGRRFARRGAGQGWRSSTHLSGGGLRRAWVHLRRFSCRCARSWVRTWHGGNMWGEVTF